MAWLIFFTFWIVFLWLYKKSEKNKQMRLQVAQEGRQLDYGQMKRDFDDAMASFNASDDFKARLSCIDSAIESLTSMEEKMPGKEVKKLPELMALKQALTYSDIKEQFEKAMKSAKEATMIVGKVNSATKAQSILNEGLALGIDKKTLSKEIEEVNNFLHRIQYDEYLAKAKKEEEKGNLKRAADQYQVALFFLKSSSMDEGEQKALVEETQARINMLYK